MRRACLVLVLVACGRPAVPAEIGASGERSVFEDRLWDDGLAEVAQYRARVERYGSLRDGRAVLIAVKERFDADALVKDDGSRRAPRALDVIKLNHVLTFPTGVYTYNQMASVFVSRRSARPVRLTVGSQEWCGVTYKRLEVRDGRATLHGSSYFGGEAERRFDVPIDERTHWADALPLWLRSLDLARPGERRLRLAGSELDNRVDAPTLGEASVRVGEGSSLEVLGRSYAVVPVRVSIGVRREVYWLEQASPHVLVRWDRADGGVYELESVRRVAYWDMHGPEDVGALAP